jgi:hypothetical protein
MVVLDGNFTGCGPGTDYPSLHILEFMIERTSAITNEVLELITFVLAQSTVLNNFSMYL